MFTYAEYRLITSIPLSSNIYELWKNTGSPAYSSIYNLARKFERMKILKIDEAKANGRQISKISPGEAYPEFAAICDKFFNQHYSRATDLLKQQIEEIAKEMKLDYQIIGGQLDPSRAYADIQIAIPKREQAKWRKALAKIEDNLNYFGISTNPDNGRFLTRKLQVIPLEFKDVDLEISKQLADKSIKDIHYGSGYAELEPYFIYLTAGARNG